jgi:type II restriction/modification system DNA methylase subunit YeeA
LNRQAKKLKIKIPNISISEQQPIIDLVNKILSLKSTNPQADTKALEKQIDRLVYGLYGLTEEEIAVIGNQKTS